MSNVFNNLELSIFVFEIFLNSLTWLGSNLTNNGNYFVSLASLWVRPRNTSLCMLVIFVYANTN